jgi:hypothetical protein
MLVKIFLTANLEKGADDGILKVYSMRGRRIMGMEPEAADERPLVYNWGEMANSTELPYGLYLIVLPAGEKNYMWSIRYSGEDLEMKGSGKAVLLPPAVAGGKPTVTPLLQITGLSTRQTRGFLCWKMKQREF